MNRRTFILSTALAGGVLVSGFVLMINRPGDPETMSIGSPSAIRPEPQPRVAAVDWSRELPPVRVAGRLRHEDEADLAFLTSGVIAEIRVANGDSVEAGDVLARLVTTDLQATVDRARADLAAAERDLLRSRRLVEDRAIPSSVMDDEQTRVDQTRAVLDAALFALERAEIRAPADGIILHRFQEPDEIVRAGQPVLSYGSVETGWVMQVGVADRDVVDLEIGDRAEIRLDALPDVVLEGRVSEIGRRSDAFTGLFTVELRVDGDGHRVRSGFIATARIHPSSTGAVARVPVDGIRRADGRSVQVIAYDPVSDLFEEVEFSFTRISGDRLYSSNLPEGVEWIVVQGQHSLGLDENG